MHVKLSTQADMVNSIIEKLVPSTKQLVTICEQLYRELDLGLRLSVSDTLKVYPTFVFQNPNGSERGKYLALDLGGTNFRILLINLQGNRESTMLNQTFALSQELMRGSGVDLFDYIALCLYNFATAQHIKNEKLSLGFTFSFPCKQIGLKKAYLTNWTKGFCCSDTVNKDVCEMLQNSLKKYPDLIVDVAAIVNDTTGTLTSCAYMNPDCQVGVIIGTGVNLCYMESDPAIFKGLQMIINTELGAFGSGNRCLDFIQTSWDKQIDSKSLNPGQQIFEKMVSGMYMGEIVRTIIVDLITQNILFNAQSYGRFLEADSFQTSHISTIELDQIDSKSFKNTRSVLSEMGIASPSHEECQSFYLICRSVSRRSAYLVSAAITTVLRKINKPSIVVGVDGSVYRRHPHFESIMYDKITELIPLIGLSPKTRFQLMLSEDGSGRGAALVAAVSSHNLPESFSHPVCQRCRHPFCCNKSIRTSFRPCLINTLT